MSILNVVSISGGKDSTAVAILALETQPLESIRFVFADTGNEHPITYCQIDYLEKAFGLPITRLRVNFDSELARKREFILNKWPEKGVPPEACERAAAAMTPTGNPYLDLCLWKGKFPSRKAQFCTQFLKTDPLVEWQMSLIDSGQCDAVWSWQGVRADESLSRRHLPEFDVRGGGLFNYRPILRWKAADCFEAHRIAGIEPNPLYRMGMSRVGCMPCINANKDEILEIATRFPDVIDRIEAWETAVAQASKRLEASFFPDPDRQAHLNKRGIRNMVRWSKTSRGGREIDMIRIVEVGQACSSAYGLCE